MESANHWSQLLTSEVDVQTARKADAGSITRLLREAPHTHIHADWHYPSDWLGSPTSVLIRRPRGSTPVGSLTGRLFGTPDPLLGCLVAAADPPPAAWVRVAAVNDEHQGQLLMAAMLTAVAGPLRDSGVNQIAWLLVEDWPERWLRELGFELVNEVLTFVREETGIPAVTHPAGLSIAPVQETDLSALAEIEARAFEPLWQHSAAALALAAQQAFSFDVAWLAGQPVGFQFSSATRRGAHLSRITIDPEAQRSGIGRALLAHALRGYYDQGIVSITLNTQLDNIASQNLYEQFGFRHNGQRFPIWSLRLT